MTRTENDGHLIAKMVDGTTFADVLHAEDTMLVTQDSKSMHRLLHATESESAYCGLRLDEGKCNVIAMNRNDKIIFGDGTELEHTRAPTRNK